MICVEAHRSILEADPLALEGRGDDPLALHIRECSSCRAMARAVLEGEKDLAEDLVAAVSLPDLDSLLDGALAPIRKRSSLRLPPKRFGLTVLPLAAAAAMAALFLGSDPQLPGELYFPSQPQPGLGLEVPTGQDVAVIATNNPDITVLWFF